MTPFVVAIVATYRRAPEVRRMLASLEHTRVPLVVLVVDNADDPETGEAVQSARVHAVRLLPGGNLGPGGGLAFGERVAFERFGDRLTHLWPMDDDIEMAPEALERLLEAMDQEKAALACPMITFPNGKIGWFPGLLEKEPFDLIRKKQVTTQAEYLKRCGPRPIRFSWATGVSLLITREAFEELGPHRTDFKIRGEDFEFSLRITFRKKGIYVPGALLAHYCFSGPHTPEAIASERKKQEAWLQNMFYIGLHLPHCRPMLRTLPGNFYRFVKNWGWSCLPSAFSMALRGALGAPAGANTKQAAMAASAAAAAR